VFSFSECPVLFLLVRLRFCAVRHKPFTRTTTWSLALLLLLLVVPVNAQSVHSLQGRVIAPDGLQPQSPVRVTLTFSGRQLYETFTDLSGRYSFTGLSKGTYQLTAAGDDRTFETTTVSAEISSFGSAPQLFIQDIQLQPLRGKPVVHAAVVSAFAQDIPRPAVQAFERGQKLEVEGKNDEALEQINEAIRIFPQYFEARLSLGNHLLKAGRLNDAIAELDRAREINPNDERLYQSFGLILMQQKNYAVAVAVFAEAFRLNPRNPLNTLMRASALIYQASAIDTSSSTGAEQQRYLLSKAEQALSQTSDLSGGKIKPDHLTLGMFFVLKGEFDRAVAELEEYLRKSPDSSNAAAIRAEVNRLKNKDAKQKVSSP